MPLPKRTAIVFLAISVSAVAISKASAFVLARAGNDTAIDRYAPFVGNDTAAGIKVVRSVSGSCSAPSRTDRESNAYLCVVRNLVYDPCFAAGTATANYVLCPLYMPNSKVLRINLDGPLPRNSAPTRAADPWAVRTADGTWCKVYTGPTYRVLGKAVSYLCTAGYILGSPHRGSTWTALFAPGYKAVNRPPGSYRRVKLASAWW